MHNAYLHANSILVSLYGSGIARSLGREYPCKTFSNSYRTVLCLPKNPLLLKRLNDGAL